MNSKSLPWRVPQILLSAQKGEEVAIVSPWFDDRLDLILPEFVSSESNPHNFTVLLEYLIKERDLYIRFYYRGGKPYLIDNLARKYPGNVRLYKRPYTHAKGVVTRRLILFGSANFLHGSFHKNEENMALTSNDFNSISEAVYTVFNLS